MDSYVEPDFESIRRTIDASGAVYSFDLLRRYHLSLRTRRFVILYGVSGSGKTLLTRMYANAVGAHYQPGGGRPQLDDKRRSVGILQSSQQAVLRY